MKQIKINDRIIGHGKPCYIIADAGINHNGDINIAKKLVDSAKKCGVDAIKFQSFSANGLLSNQAISAAHTDEFDIFDLIKGLELSREDHKILFDYCEKREITFLSTPLDFYHADLLEDLGVVAYKIASCDVNNTPLLRYVAKKKKAMIMSTGMASMNEISEAVDTVYSSGNKKLALFHCVSMYPPDDKTLNLNFMDSLSSVFGVPIGFSDHTIGTVAPIVAITMGAAILEKHFTLDKKMPGPDQAISADPDELKFIVDSAKRIDIMKGDGVKHISKQEREVRRSFRRSIVAKKDLKKSEIITEELLDYKRPGTQIPPNKVDFILGRKLKRSIKQNDLIKISDLA